MKRSILKWLLCACMAAANFVVADTIVVPPGQQTVEGGGGSSVLNNSIRLQEMYDATLFPSVPITISEIRFRPSAPYGAAFSATISNITIRLSTTPVAVAAIGLTFAENVGTNETVVFGGALPLSSAFTGPSGGPKAFDIIVPLTTPFTYYPSQGNLLVDIKNVSGSLVTYVDAAASPDAKSSRVFALGSDSTIATGADFGSDVLELVYSILPAPPVIVTQPASQSVILGGNVSFSVTAQGSAPLYYQWRHEGEDITGATASTFALTNVQAADAGVYSVIVSNELGSVTSSDASLTVTNPPPPHIVAQPSSQIVLRGDTATFSVGATGVGPITYQWKRDGEDLAGATSDSLVLTNVQPAQAGAYSAVVLNPYGSATSAVAVLIVTNTSGLVVHPTFAQREGGGGSSSLFNNIRLQEVYSSSFFPTGSILITEIRWRPSATSGGPSSTVINNFQLNLSTTTRQPGQLSATFASNPGADDTVVFHGSLSVTSAFTGPATGPKDFDIVVPLTTPFPYDSRLGNLLVDIRNFSGSTVSAVDAGAPAGGVSRVFALGASTAATGASDGGADVLQITYASAELAPFITLQPQSQTVTKGSSIVFSVGAGGSAPLAYQWSYNGVPIDGANASTLNLTGVQLDQAGSYSVLVSNALGTVASSNAVLVVNPPPVTVRIVDVNGAGGTEVIVPVQLVANGVENALGFSLTFNPNLLGFVGASLGVDAPASAALLANTNEVAAGRLGLAIGLPANAVFPEGTQQVVLVTFLAAPVLNQTTATVGFGNQPTVRQVSGVSANILPATFVNGTVSIADSLFEADAAPRPNGDRSVGIIDWVQMGRFVARLDPISSPNEFQRADCAPRATRGNGKLAASDWVQAGRYAVGLDPLTVLGGPTEEDAGEQGGFAAASASGRQLCLANTTIAQGQTNTVPVTLECQGNENAATFSVTFDPAKLSFAGATPGTGAAAGLLNLNTSELAQGRLGVAMAMRPGATLAAGNQEILKLRFAALATAPATATMGFASSPIPREVSDVAANPLSTEYTAGTVSVTPPPGPPLRITRTGNSLYITWLTSGSTGFELEATAGALGTAWSRVDGVIDLGEQKLAIVPFGGSERYFRLKKP